MSEQLTDMLDALLECARKAGAEQADALAHQSNSLQETLRLGRLDSIERSESASLGLRVLIGKRQASVASGRLDASDFPMLAERAVAMASLAPEDIWCGLGEASTSACETALELDDGFEADESLLRERAQQAEEVALEFEGVTNSEGAVAKWSRGNIAFANSEGFSGSYSSSLHHLACTVVAEKNGEKERDYAYSIARHFDDLDAPDVVGREAAERALARMGARKPQGAQLPVVFDERIASSLLHHLAQAVSGASIARGVSFLDKHLEKLVFAEGIDILDDPMRPRGLASRPFDDEGITGGRLLLVEKGVLKSWLLDSASARQLGFASTGHASRSAAEPPSSEPSNLHMLPGKASRDELIADISSGLYVTELIGMGVNPVTGDYSRGAAGFWIENGKIAYPVSEVTVAGNLKEMFARVTPADDLRFRASVNAPSLRIEGMMVAGL